MEYPIYLNVQQKKCVIIGGGRVATRKAETLLNSGASITIISPTITDQIKSWTNEKQIKYKEKFYEARDLKDAFMIIAATNDRATNLKVLTDKEKHQLINIVDQPVLSDFIVPATFSRGKLSIAITTGGASPSLSKKIKRDLEELYDESFELYIDFLETSRKMVKEKVHEIERRKNILSKLLDPIFLSLTREKKIEQRDRLLVQLIEEDEKPNFKE